MALAEAQAEDSALPQAEREVPRHIPEAVKKADGIRAGGLPPKLRRTGKQPAQEALGSEPSMAYGRNEGNRRIPGPLYLPHRHLEQALVV